MKKFGDDNAGPSSPTSPTPPSSRVPLLLVLVSILNLVLAHDPSARTSLLNSAFSEFPVVGSQLSHNIHGLQRSSVVASSSASWPDLGLDRAGPGGALLHGAGLEPAGAERPNYVTRLGRSLTFLVVLGSAWSSPPPWRASARSAGTTWARGPGRGRCRPRQHRRVLPRLPGAHAQVVESRVLVPGRSWAGSGGHSCSPSAATSSATTCATTAPPTASSVLCSGSSRGSIWARSSPSTPPSSTPCSTGTVAARPGAAAAHRGRPALDGLQATRTSAARSRRWRSTTTSRPCPSTSGWRRRGRGSRRSGDGDAPAPEHRRHPPDAQLPMPSSRRPAPDAQLPDVQHPTSSTRT